MTQLSDAKERIEAELVREYDDSIISVENGVHETERAVTVREALDVIQSL